MFWIQLLSEAATPQPTVETGTFWLELVKAVGLPAALGIALFYFTFIKEKLVPQSAVQRERDRADKAEAKAEYWQEKAISDFLPAITSATTAVTNATSTLTIVQNELVRPGREPIRARGQR